MGLKSDDGNERRQRRKEVLSWVTTARLLTVGVLGPGISGGVRGVLPTQVSTRPDKTPFWSIC